MYEIKKQSTMTKKDLISVLWECDQNCDAFRPFVTDGEMEFIADKLISYCIQFLDKRIDELKISRRGWKRLIKEKHSDYLIFEDKIKEINGAIKECEYLKERNR
jgi:hypothetical protein